MNLSKVIALLKCPKCSRSTFRESASGILCTGCQNSYALIGKTLHMHSEEMVGTPDARFQKEQMTGSSLAGRLYNFGKLAISSEYVKEDHLRKFLAQIKPTDVLLELGSGDRTLTENAINVDLFPFPTVDVTMDIQRTSFRDEVADYIVLDCVLEHVPEPAAVVREVHRILKPGGQVLSISPWVFPYHGYPKNYFNISQDGLEVLFNSFRQKKITTHHGPTSALTNLFSEYFAAAFANRSNLIYTLVKGLFLAPIFWLKYVDRLWSVDGAGKRIASSLCIIARK